VIRKEGFFVERKMYSKSTYRPRRTRLYGASYDIGESYYKHALDNLDKNSRTISFSDTPIEHSNHSFLKREGRGASTEIIFPQLASRNIYFDENKDDHHTAFHRAHTENPSNKISSRKFPDLLQEESSFTNRASALERRKDDLHGRNELKLIAKSGADNIEKKSFINDEFVKKSVIQKTRNFGFEEDSADTKASLRAKATRTRLANLESEMLQMSEKQSERDKRNLNLKKLLSKSDSEDFNINKAIL